MYLIRSNEGVIATDIKDFRARFFHMEPTLNYAIACAGYAESRKLLVAELQSSLAEIEWQVDDLLEEMTATATRKTKKTGQHVPKRVTRIATPQQDPAARKLVLRVREPRRTKLRRIKGDVMRLQGLVERFPSINDITEPQLHGHVHESTVELVKARWEFRRTGSFGAERAAVER